LPIDRRSWQHLVDFLDNYHSHHRDIDAHEDEEQAVISTLFFELFQLESSDHSHSDGGVEVLQSLFARSDTTLTKVTIRFCNFGSQEEATRLLAAFHANRTVIDLTIDGIMHLEGTALGNSLSGLMQNMTQLHRLECSRLFLDGVRVFQPTLQANRTLRELSLPSCWMGDEAIRLIADALVGNGIMEGLDIRKNNITSVGLADIMRLLAATRLMWINLSFNKMLDDINVTHRFFLALSRHEFLKELGLEYCRLGNEGIHHIAGHLADNAIMEALFIGYNRITSAGLADIIRMIESTQLQTIGLSGNRKIFHDEATTQHFVSTLRHARSSVQDFHSIDFSEDFSEGSEDATYARIENSLTRNQQLNRAFNLLLAPPPQQQERNAAVATAS
jgi:Leucine Rich repeat